MRKNRITIPSNHPTKIYTIFTRFNLIFTNPFANILIICLLTFSFTFVSLTRGDEDVDVADIEFGKKIYNIRCEICHGSEGDGNGLVGIIRKMEKSGRVLNTYSRDFTMGVFKFRTTSTGCLPDDKDLMRVITDGISTSFMPSHEDVSLEEREAVLEYIKIFSPRWEEEDPCEIITVKKPEWVGSPVSVKKGKKVYKEMKCRECHGEQGKGDGPKADELVDDWGYPIKPFNFTTGALKRGSAPEDVYITFTAGLDGTGMPSYEDSLNEDDRWHLVSYTLKLMEKVE